VIKIAQLIGLGAASTAARQMALSKATFGAQVTVEPSDFLSILEKNDKPLVVMKEKKKGRIFKHGYFYMTGYKGFIFRTQSPTPLELPRDAEVIITLKIF
jgi:hypothetical protein